MCFVICCFRCVQVSCHLFSVFVFLFRQITMYVCDVHYSYTVVKEMPTLPACLRPMHAHAQYVCSMCISGAGSGLSDE